MIYTFVIFITYRSYHIYVHLQMNCCLQQEQLERPEEHSKSVSLYISQSSEKAGREMKTGRAVPTVTLKSSKEL